MKKFLVVLIISCVLFLPNVYAQRGCCSHHGGEGGCSSSGQVICNDGSLSPTCTCEAPETSSVSSISYGCTNNTAINYDSSANKDDGSCKNNKTITEQEEIPYETIFEEDSSLKTDETKIKTNGENGIKTITYNITINESNEELSRAKVKEEITKEKVNQVVLRNTKKNNSFSTFLVLSMLGGVGYLLKKKTNK
jgi:hypothetical protein